MLKLKWMSDLNSPCPISLDIMIPQLMLEFSKIHAIFERAIKRAKTLCNLWQGTVPEQEEKTRFGHLVCTFATKRFPEFSGRRMIELLNRFRDIHETEEVPYQLLDKTAKKM